MKIPGKIEALAIAVSGRKLWLPSELDEVLGMDSGATYQAITRDPTLVKPSHYVMARGALLRSLKDASSGRVAENAPRILVIGERAVRRLLSAHAPESMPEYPQSDAEPSRAAHGDEGATVGEPQWSAPVSLRNNNTARFLTDCCAPLAPSDPQNKWAPRSAVYAAYLDWCAANGVASIGKSRLYRALEALEVRSGKSGTDRFALRLLDAPAPAAAPLDAEREVDARVGDYCAAPDLGKPVWIVTQTTAEGGICKAARSARKVLSYDGVPFCLIKWHGSDSAIVDAVADELGKLRAWATAPVVLVCDDASVNVMRGLMRFVSITKHSSLTDCRGVWDAIKESAAEAAAEKEINSDLPLGAWRASMRMLAPYLATESANDSAPEPEPFNLKRDGEAEARRCRKYLERWQQYEQARKAIKGAERELADLARR